MRAFRVLMVIYFSFLYNVNSLGISRRYWRISSSSFEVKQYLPPPSASPREVGRYCITSQDSEDILQYLLEMPRLLSHCLPQWLSYCFPLQPDFNSSSLYSVLFTSSCLLTKLEEGFKKFKKCIVWLFPFNIFGQFIRTKHLTDLVDNSKQQQSVKNSDVD